MNRSTRFAALAFVQTLVAAGCSERGPIAPTGLAPDVAQSPPVAATGELVNGIVYDTGQRTVGGATVEVIDGPQTGTSTIANEKGEFSLRGTFDDATRFRVSKEGHTAEVKTLNPYCERCNPHRWIFFSLDVLAVPVSVAGDYTLTFIADASCTTIPDEARARTYAATITPAPHRPQTSFDVTVTGAPILAGYQKGWLSVAGDYVAFGVGDWHGRPGIVEELARHTYVGFDGSAEASVQGATLSTIATHFAGLIDYCERTSEVGATYDCSASPGVVHKQCTSQTHRLVLTRR